MSSLEEISLATYYCSLARKLDLNPKVGDPQSFVNITLSSRIISARA